jgi:hypothetical protein
MNAKTSTAATGPARSAASVAGPRSNGRRAQSAFLSGDAGAAFDF